MVEFSCAFLPNLIDTDCYAAQMHKIELMSSEYNVRNPTFLIQKEQSS